MCVGLGLGLSQPGCAKLRSATQATPLMLGSAAPFKKSAADASPGGDLYAQEVGKGVAQSRALLAQSRARKGARSPNPRSRPEDEGLLAESPSNVNEPSEVPRGEGLEVALQPPISLPARGPATEAPQSDGLTSVPAEPAREATPAPTPDAQTLATIVNDSQARIASLTSYQVPITRQERVGTALLPSEQIVLSIRREPRAVRIEWPDGPSKGREVIFSATEHDGLMHVKMPESVIPVPPLALSPDSPMVKRTSRHPITEAGFEGILEKLSQTISQASAPDSPLGKVTYGGLDNPGTLERPAHKIVRVTPSGESWQVFIDPTTKFPVLLEGTAANGDLLERYQFGEPAVDLPDLAKADAFDPNSRWGPPSGLLSRIARAGGSAARTNETAPR